MEAKIKEKELDYYRVLIRFSSNSNNFSCMIPKDWTVKVLKNFISFSFKNEVNQNFSIIYCGKILQKDEEEISNIFKKDEILNLIFISFNNKIITCKLYGT